MEFDKKLYVKLDHCEGEHYLLGNCHTFPGRMDAYCTLKDKTFCVSLSEISEMSEEAKYWIMGFLNGNEPSPPDELESETPEEYFRSLRYQNWRSKIEEFRRTGIYE